MELLWCITHTHLSPLPICVLADDGIYTSYLVLEKVFHQMNPLLSSVLVFFSFLIRIFSSYFFCFFLWRYLCHNAPSHFLWETFLSCCHWCANKRLTTKSCSNSVTAEQAPASWHHVRKYREQKFSYLFINQEITTKKNSWRICSSLKATAER